MQTTVHVDISAEYWTHSATLGIKIDFNIIFKSV